MRYISDKDNDHTLINNEWHDGYYAGKAESKQRIKELEAELKTEKEHNSAIIEAIEESFPEPTFLDGMKIIRIENYNSFVDKINKAIEL